MIQSQLHFSHQDASDDVLNYLKKTQLGILFQSKVIAKKLLVTSDDFT